MWIGLDRTLERSASALSPMLASPAALVDVRGVAAQLPAQASNCVYFEAPLAGDRRRVDIIVRIERAAAGALTSAATHAPGCGIPHGAIWTRIRDLAASWQSPSSALARGGDVLWLEFDVDEDTRHRLASAGGSPPGVFVDLLPPVVRQLPIPHQLDLIDETLAPLVDDARRLRHRLLVRRCLDALPNRAALTSIGVLLPRGDTTVRVCVRGIRPAALSTLLRAIGWPGSIRKLEALRSALDVDVAVADDAPALSLVHLDLDEDLLPRIGIEYRFRQRPQVHGRLAEAAFLQRLVDVGLCSPDRQVALRAWPGCAVETMPHELWESVVRRHVNHVKIVYDEAHGPQAKGYLRMTHVLRRPRTHPSTE